jgi:hypothetical protein
MTTARTAPRKPASPRAAAAKSAPAKPSPVKTELTAGERLAADLRALADLVEKTTAPADSGYADVLVVLQIMDSDGQRQLADVLADRGAVEQPARDSASPLYSQQFTERTFLLSGGSVRVSTSSYTPADDIEAAGR